MLDQSCFLCPFKVTAKQENTRRHQSGVSGFHMCSSLSSLCKSSPPADQGQLPLLDGNSSRLLVPGWKAFKVSWQQLWLVISPGKSMLSLGTRTSNPAESRVVGAGSAKSLSGASGMIVSRVTPASISWFPDPCILIFEDIALYRGLRFKTYTVSCRGLLLPPDCCLCTVLQCS